MTFHHLKKFLGYLKKTMDFCLVVEFPQAGGGYVKKGGTLLVPRDIFRFRLERKKSHRKSTSGGFHALSSCPLFNSSRTQKIIGLSSCEAELRAIVSSASDCIHIRSVLEFALGTRWTITSSQILRARGNLR